MGGTFPVFRYYRAAVSCTFGAMAFCLSSNAFGQSTPTELADMTLEDLLDFEITEPDAVDSKSVKKWEFAYTYRKLSSGGYRTGTQDLSFQDVLFSPGEIRTGQNYPVVPTFICQTVHAFSAGYKINDELSVNFIVPLINQGTDHISSVPGFADFLLKSDGIGDIGVSGSYQKRLSEESALRFNLGFRLPVGSIDEEGDTPRGGMGTLERLPYTMQIGSGTFDITSAAAYSRMAKHVKWGINANATIRTGKNDNDYRLGNNFGTAAWIQYSKNHWFQPGVKLSLRKIEKIKGADTSLLVPNPAFPYPASITNPDNYGGTKGHIAALIKICPKADCNLSFSAEYGEPIYQKLKGVQPKDRDHFSITSSVRF